MIFIRRPSKGFFAAPTTRLTIDYFPFLSHSPILEIANYRIEEYYDGSLVSSCDAFLLLTQLKNFFLFIFALSSAENFSSCRSRLGARMLHKCRQLLAGVFLRRQHFGVLHPAAIYPNRPLFGDCQTFDDQSEPDFGAGQSKQLH